MDTRVVTLKLSLWQRINKSSFKKDLVKKFASLSIYRRTRRKPAGRLTQATGEAHTTTYDSQHTTEEAVATSTPPQCIIEAIRL